ncbi:MAG: ABC transporter substrate-binding protein [Pseudonocardiaceae bacterium]
MVESPESRSWFRRLALPVRITVIVVVTLLILGGGYWVYLEASHRAAAKELALHTCGPGVARIDGQCIGVTDGSVHLIPDLADVLDKIRQENAEVDRSGRSAVSVVHLLALPNPAANNTLAVTLRHELEGAYLAQRVANGSKSSADEPLLRLLVANDGDRSQHWHQVAAAVVGKVNGPERVVAAIASGTTLTGRQEAIGTLTDQGIPVIASRLTGDSLIPTDHASPTQGLAPVQGLVRLPPSNRDQATAVVTYLKNKSGITRALLVQSIDPEDGYSKSLGEAFQATFPDDTHTVLNPVELYNPRLGGVPATMKGMLFSICEQKPDVVFFAGRSPELQALVIALPARPCPDFRINIVTADGAVHFATTVARDDAELRKGMNANMSVKYTALAHPGSWQESAGSFASGPRDFFQSACEKCFRTLFPGEFPGQPLNDGGAIIGHDAIAIAIAAIRTREGTNDTPSLIIQEFNRMHGPRAVPGASGWISLDGTGDPINRAMPILEVKPDGAVDFVQLSSSLSSPCRPDVPALC